MNKRQKIQERIEKIEIQLANAEEYVARNVNVEGASWLHTSDWQGKSGHPLWMKNFMIPSLKKVQKRKEKALENISSKNRERRKQRRQRRTG